MDTSDRGLLHCFKHARMAVKGMTGIQNALVKCFFTVVCFLLGNSPVSEFYMPTFRNTLSHLHRPMKTEQAECSETLPYKIQMPGNYPEERIQHVSSLSIGPEHIGDFKFPHTYKSQ